MSNKIDMTSMDWSQVPTGYFVATKRSTSAYKLEVVDKATLKARRKEKGTVCNLNKVIGIFNDSTVDRSFTDVQIKSLKDRMEVGSKKHNTHWYRCLRFLGLPLLIAKMFGTDIFTTYQTPKIPSKDKEPGKGKTDHSDTPAPAGGKSLSAGKNPLPGDIPSPAGKNSPSTSGDVSPSGPPFHKSDELYPLLEKPKDYGELSSYLKRLDEEDLDKILNQVFELIETHPQLGRLIPIILFGIKDKVYAAGTFARLQSLLTSESDFAKAVLSHIDSSSLFHHLDYIRLQGLGLKLSHIPIFIQPWIDREKREAAVRLFLKLSNLDSEHLDLFFRMFPELAVKMSDVQLTNLGERYLGADKIEEAKLVMGQLSTLSHASYQTKLAAFTKNCSQESINKLLAD